jgi:uncharacterized membrane protein
MSHTTPRTENEATDSAQQDAAAQRAQTNRDALLQQSELIISNVLRGGVLLSAAVILLGTILFYIRWVGSSHSTNAASFPHSLVAVGQGLAHGDPLAIIALGLLMLLATPVLRVAVSVITFGLERDWLYTAITLLVLAILVLSFLFGKGGA